MHQITYRIRTQWIILRRHPWGPLGRQSRGVKHNLATSQLYHKWDVKNAFAFVFQFFSLISDGLGGMTTIKLL